MSNRRCAPAIVIIFAATVTACGTAEREHRQAVADSTVVSMRTQMNAVDDTLQRLLGSLDTNRAKVEVRLAESQRLEERLSADAPGVLRRLDAFVVQYKALQVELRAKDDTIKQLRDKYQGLLASYAKEKALNAKLESQIDSLKADTAARGRRLAQVDSARVTAIHKSNSAQYIVATRKMLEDSHIVRKLERFGRLSVDPTAPNTGFTATDVSTLKEVPIAAARDAIELVSLHPTGSYTLENGTAGTRLVIIDPDAFWSTTRRLVVMIK
jgi:hypothetical protein